jgi:lipopolysaccharide/colanic/teichoic acid biosynthesis glycosyltransferase
MSSGSRASQEDPSVTSHAGWNVVERGLALALWLVALPVVALIALWIRVADGAPVFYHGTRLGRAKRPFLMLKLRTLRLGADKITGGELLGSRLDLTIRGGRFLRETRLDELPQLLNIVLGHMSFVGPRPERPEVVAEKSLEGIPGYERRFAVRPGLIGISQVFTPHGTPKRYRALLDNGGLRRVNGLARVGIVLFTVWAVANEILRRTLRQLAVARARRRVRRIEERRLRRVVPHGAVAHLGPLGTTRLRSARLVDINEEALRVECEGEALLEREALLVLDIPVRGHAGHARRTAVCRGQVTQRRREAGREHLVIHYRPLNERSEYMVHQYFLQGSLAVPRRSLNGSAPPFTAATPPTARVPRRSELSPG